MLKLKKEGVCTRYDKKDNAERREKERSEEREK